MRITAGAVENPREKRVDPGWVVRRPGTEGWEGGGKKEGSGLAPGIWSDLARARARAHARIHRGH